jgi:hypothetical protein
LGLNHNLYHTERTFKKRKNQTKGAFWAKKFKERDLTKWFNDEEISSCINEFKKILGITWVTGGGELYDTYHTDVKLIELVIFLIVNLTV